MEVLVTFYRFLIVTIFLSIALLSACGSKSELWTEIDEPLLFQSYEIQTQDNQTEVNASVFFEETLDGRDSTKFLPDKVVVNNQPLKKQRLESFVLGSSFKVVENNDHHYIRAEGDSDFDGYNGLLPLKENYFKFEVTDRNNNTKTFDLFFEPFEFEDSAVIRLSRSKETLITIKGQSAENKSCSIFGLGDSENTTESLIDINTDKKIIKISPKLVRNIQESKIDLSIFTIEHNYLDQVASRNGTKFPVKYTGRYMISNLSKTKAEIVD